MSSKTRPLSRYVKYVAGPCSSRRILSPGARCQTPTRRSGSWNGNAFSSTPYTTLKIAVLAPIPKASVRAATTAKPGCFRSMRAAQRRSCERPASTCPVGAPGVIDGGECACRSGAMCFAKTSLPLKSASVRCVASSGDAPPAINSRQRSSRCCENSSTISFSRVGESRSDANRARTCSAQSGMFVSRDAPHSLDECGPRLPLLCKHTSPFSRDAVEAAAPIPWVFDPQTLDPSTLEAIEQGIEGIDVERELTTRTVRGSIAQLVTLHGAARRAGRG